MSKKPKIIVFINGGNFQGTIATCPIDIHILDYDNWRAGDPLVGEPCYPDEVVSPKVFSERLKKEHDASLR